MLVLSEQVSKELHIPLNMLQIISEKIFSESH